MRKVYGDGAGDAWQALNPRILTVTKGWSEAYGLFVKGEAPLVLSYTTSPAYHRIAESDSRYEAAVFDEGHNLQVEVAAKLRSAPNPRARRPLPRLRGERGLSAAHPHRQLDVPGDRARRGLPEGFSQPLDSEQTLSFGSEEVFEHRKQWIDDWLQAMSR